MLPVCLKGLMVTPSFAGRTPPSFLSKGICVNGQIAQPTRAVAHQVECGLLHCMSSSFFVW